MGRRVVRDFLGLTVEHCMYGLLEADVTIARRVMEEHFAATGERLSFTGYIVWCLAQAIDADRSVQAYLKGRKQIVLFDDVDVGILIERMVEDKLMPVGSVIRAANHKSFREIHDEIRALQYGSPPKRAEMPRWLRLLSSLPGPTAWLVRAIVRAAKRRNPAGMWVALAGTVAVSSVGMFGSGGGWAISAAEHTLGLYVGGIATRPAYVQGALEPHEFVSLTFAFDHEVVDGAPAVRLIQRFLDLLEQGRGLGHAAP